MARNTTPSDPGSDSSLPVTTPRRGEFPDVGRPRGHALRSLEAEGILFESQVLIVGGESDLAARLMLTSKRLVLAAGGEIAIEIPREWLRPQPRLVAENGIRIFVTPEGAEAGGNETERISLRARDGRGAAMQLIAALTGRPVPGAQPESRTSQSGASVSTSTPSIAAEVPTWSSAVGASPTVGLPPLPDFLNAPPASAANAERPSWPPVEKQGISSPSSPAIPTRTQPGADGSGPYRQAPATGPTDVTFRGRTNGSIAGWTSRHLDSATPTPTPAAVPSSVSRAARKQGTLADGVTIADTAVAPVVVTEAARPGLGHRSLVWGLRLAIILVLLGTGIYLGRDYLRQQAVDLNVPLPARIESQLGISSKREQVAQVTSTDTGNQLEANSGDADPVATLPAARGDNTRDDLGGTTGPLPTTTTTTAPTEVPVVVPTDVPTNVPAEAPTDIPTDEPVVVPTDVPAEAPTDVPVVVPTDVPTEEPTPEPTVAPTLEPTTAPTEVPTTEPTEVPTLEPTQAPTEVPTTEPTQVPTLEPTVAPTKLPTTAPTLAPTEKPTLAPTQAPTEQPTTEATVQSTATVVVTPTLEPQAPSVDPSVTPDQQIATTDFRFNVAGAEMGESIPDLPQITTVTYGQWLVLAVTGKNTSSTAQVFDMKDFRLLADGSEVQVDVGNGWVAGMLGYTPAYGNTDSILWAPGESHQFALTFLAPLDAKSLELQVGNQTMDLSSALGSDKSLLSASQQDASTMPEYIEAKVLKVVNAETILVEVDGVQQPVRYLGLDAPTGDECFAVDATKANAALVEGKTVRIERQATNVDAKGNWVRDVWAPNSDGTYELVSAMLVSQGAARSGVTQPNTRFSGWLMGSESAAKAQGLGLWKSCGSGDTAAIPDGNQPHATTPAPSAAIVPNPRNGMPS